jgi:hypothetical protein
LTKRTGVVDLPSIALVWRFRFEPLFRNWINPSAYWRCLCFFVHYVLKIIGGGSWMVQVHACRFDFFTRRFWSIRSTSNPTSSSSRSWNGLHGWRVKLWF